MNIYGLTTYLTAQRPAMVRNALIENFEILVSISYVR